MKKWIAIATLFVGLLVGCDKDPEIVVLPEEPEKRENPAEEPLPEPKSIEGQSLPVTMLYSHGFRKCVFLSKADKIQPSHYEGQWPDLEAKEMWIGEDVLKGHGRPPFRWPLWFFVPRTILKNTLSRIGIISRKSISIETRCLSRLDTQVAAVCFESIQA